MNGDTILGLVKLAQLGTKRDSHLVLLIQLQIYIQIQIQMQIQKEIQIKKIYEW